MTTDLGLTVAAYADDSFFLGEGETVTASLERAWRLGAPLISARLGRETDLPWSEQIEAIGRAAALAKGANVTLAVRNAPGTYAATGHDCKRIAKEADSAWLRFGLQPGSLDAATDPAGLIPHTVLLFCESALPPQRDRTEAFSSFRGFLTLDRDDGAASPEGMRDALERRRR
jgi:hypothetical protein